MVMKQKKQNMEHKQSTIGTNGPQKSHLKPPPLMSVHADLISMVSHEIRTPLSIIKEGTSLMNDQVLGPVNDKQKETLGIVLSSADRLNTLINDLLDLSRLDAGKLNFHKEEQNITHTIQSVLPGFELKAASQKVHIAFEPLDMPTVFIDNDKIIQVLTNLIGNALKFSGDDQTITLTLQEEESSIRVNIADQGPGIDPEDIPELFTKFKQLNTQQPLVQRGSGLGLMIAKQIIDRSDGHISVKSTPGEGSVFSFTVPKFQSSQELIDQALTHFKREKQPFSVLMISFNHPQILETRYGPEATTICQQALSKALSKVLLKSEDMIIHDDDHSCIIFLHDCPKKGAVAVREKIIKCLSHSPAGSLTDDVKFGLSTYKEDSVDIYQMIPLAQADLSLRKTVLVISSDRAYVSTLDQHIGHAPFQCVHAYCSQEGLKKAIDLNPALMIIDQDLLQKAGQNLLTELQHHQQLQTTPIVMIAGPMEMSQENINPRVHGHIPVISKSCDSHLLISVIKQSI